MIGLPADPNDPEDRDVSAAAVQHALAEREARRVNRGGRPKGAAKQQVTLRLDKDIVEKLRASGAGWQTRVNEMLRRAVG
ncbi:MAG: BrnA antitoxin family protein [Sphingobium sp.]